MKCGIGIVLLLTCVRVRVSTATDGVDDRRNASLRKAVKLSDSTGDLNGYYGKLISSHSGLAVTGGLMPETKEWHPPRRLLPKNDKCGDGACKGNENCSSCEVDCGECTPAPGGPSPSPAPVEEPSPTANGPAACVDSGGPCETDADCGMACDKGKDGGNPCSSGDECSGSNVQCTAVVGSCLVVTDPPTVSPPTSGIGNTIIVSSASEISAAMQSAQPGDALVMKNDGTWTDADIVFSGNGVSGSPITLRAETAGLVVLTGTSRIRMSGNYLVVDGLKFDGGSVSSGQQVVEFRTGTSPSDYAHHCRVTNTAIVDYNPSNSGTDYRWVGLYGTNNRVDHCYFSGKDHVGPLMVVWRPSPTEDFHRIDHNYFGDFTSGGGENGWETLRIGTSSTSLSDSSSVVERNLFLRCNGEIEIISVKSGNNVLRGNTFDSSEGMLTLRHGRGNTVDGNFFLGRGIPNTGGVRIIDSDHNVTNNYMEKLRGTNARGGLVLANGKSNSALNEYFPVERAVVAFNTLHDVTEAIRIGWRSSSNDVEVKDSFIANNAVRSFGTSASQIIVEDAPPTNMIYEGNYMHGVPLGIISPGTSGINDDDPQLTLGGDGLHRPTAGSSPCIDGAIGSYPEVLFDMDGQPRPSSDNDKDVGADENASDLATGTSGPLYATDVGGLIGPSWM